MALKGWFRALGLAAMAATMVAALAAQAGDTEAIEGKLLAQFKTTRMSEDRSEIVAAGDRVIIQKPGLTMYAVASPMPPFYTYKNGKIGHGLTGLEKDVEISVATPGGTAADYPRRALLLGERCWVSGLKVQKDGVLFQLSSERYEGTRYYANLKIAFPNRKELPPAETVLHMVAEVLTVAPAEARSSQPIPVSAPPPASTALTKQLAQVAGKYDFDGGDSQLDFVSGTGCVMVSLGAESAGKYRVTADRLMIDCTMTGSSFSLKIEGDKLVADDGHVWTRESGAPPLAPSVFAGQSKAQVIGAFGQPVRVVKSGVKEILYYNDMKVTFTNGRVTSVE